MTSIDIYSILSSKPHNEHYLKRYFKFIQYCQTLDFTGLYMEEHHICPKSDDLFPEYISLKENPWNKINLPDQHHFIAHWMLWKAFGGKQTFAFMAMANGQNSKQMGRQTKRINSKTYTILKSDRRAVSKLINKGKACYIDKIGERYYISINDPRVLSGELIAQSKGREQNREWTEERRIGYSNTIKNICRIKRVNRGKTIPLYFLEYRITVNFYSDEYIHFLDQGWSTKATPEFKLKVTAEHNKNFDRSKVKNFGKRYTYYTPYGIAKSASDKSIMIHCKSYAKLCGNPERQINNYMIGQMKIPKDWVGKTPRQLGFYREINNV